ncbi:DUF2281 domain-containing protein [Dolichospermum sp. LEGE 00240]|jgi:hypothetical protein|uniref:DUF2281 domain-containing protein n=1 Tax=Dolichospermum sp. LEGE 00240 TaxID=1828603 RepID=UPI00187DE13A|nr:DUF2281 domain-containing protein [Dolichospermum sp. LEGE 00240]MDM3847997.1 DUF2281 domain-containing protein [Aphanizomenon gracile PMC638.10]MDM3853013.1 DUF2281 domain-containing protein [Aphanizomenon gracile PMC627.10]MDM3853655.1 DUF2281 domain-containing protein [Aphanizomenon gracile PMC649.10]MDM3862705.1 DUF2281 domain-containing protein [Aphanizomenon gracile PMC644.10]MBE9250650.1 DUF2281 domain-containing protein [Dolichospermum sp. LEGE 00240]
MITLEMAIAKIKQLPLEQRNEVIKFIEFLEFKAGNIDLISQETKTTKNYPLRGKPITIASDFDEPMPERWEALAE